MEVRIPKSRIAVLIGVKGKTRYILERKTKTKLKISSKEGTVDIESDDPFNIYHTEKIVKAIGRGFNPEIALTLVDEDNCFELIDMKILAGNSKIKLARMKSRIIGTRGKCRKTIETISDVNISIHGKTVGIIGKIENVQIARVSILDILRGAPHGPVYKTLEERISMLQE